MNIQSLIVDFAREHDVTFYEAASAVTGIKPTDDSRKRELDRLAAESIRFDDEMRKDRLRARRVYDSIDDYDAGPVHMYAIETHKADDDNRLDWIAGFLDAMGKNPMHASEAYIEGYKFGERC